MKEININFLHPLVYYAKENKDKINIIRYLLGINEEDLGYKFTIDKDKCDYLFVSESLYYGLENIKTIKEYRRIVKKCNPVVIFYAGECIEPDFNIFDYAIVFDNNLKCEDRCCKLPKTLRFKEQIADNLNMITTKDEALKLLKTKKYFCNFIYSNPNAHINRDKLFYDISKYKQVYSLGKHLKNFEIPKEELTQTKDWAMESIELKNRFKFSIAAENASYPGYTSEKIMTSLQAHTIPIYWGNPLIKLDYNEECFINANDFSSNEKLIEYIKKIDNDDDLWCEIISKPWQTKEQMKEENNQIENYKNFFKKIFSQNIEEGKRIAQGFHPNNYRNSFDKKLVLEVKINIVKKVLRKLKIVKR